MIIDELKKFKPRYYSEIIKEKNNSDIFVYDKLNDQAINRLVTRLLSIGLTHGITFPDTVEFEKEVILRFAETTGVVIFNFGKAKDLNITHFLTLLQICLDIIKKYDSNIDYNELRSFINKVFYSERIGYCISEENQVIRYSDTFEVKEIIEPLLHNLKKNIEYKQTISYFEKALDYLFRGEYPRVINEAKNCLESGIKIFFKKENVSFEESDTLKELITKLDQSKKINVYHKNFLVGMKTLIEHGIAPARNQNGDGGHGKSIQPSVNENEAKLVLNISFSLLQFLINL